MADEAKSENQATAVVAAAAKSPENSPREENPEESKKRQNEGSNNENKSKYNSSKRSKKERKKNHTWRKTERNESTRTIATSKKEPNGGSFANPAMRELFGVTLPPHLVPPTTKEEKESPTGDNDGPRKTVKRKVAFLLAYLGTGYAGFQSNAGQRTLQAEFELALLKSELLNPLNMGYFFKYGWSTSGRTDKGVHACAQVCSAKIQILPDQTWDDVRELINQHLPENFRVLDVVKTTKSFCAKTGRSRVRYQYMIPAFFLQDRKELRELMTKVAPLEKEGRTPGEKALSEGEVNEIKELVKNYRVGKDKLDSLQNALRLYEGTHSFHNFTNKLTSKDASATRYIVSFNVEEPIIFENGMQWVPTQVVGQSFLIHQIRKMVSVAVDSVQLGVPDLITKALDKGNKMRSDLAPPQGLFMEMSFYDGYNQRLKNHESDVKELKWHCEETDAFKRWKKFREEVLMEHIVKEEQQEGNFIQHLYNHESYFHFDEYYGLTKGEESIEGNEKE